MRHARTFPPKDKLLHVIILIMKKETQCLLTSDFLEAAQSTFGSTALTHISGDIKGIRKGSCSRIKLW